MTMQLLRHILLRLALGLVAALVILGVLPALIVGLSLDRARDSLTAALSALRAGNTSEAAALVDRAVSSASSAESASDAPVLRAIASLTGLGDDLVGTRALATALHHAATGGTGVVQAARSGGADELGLAGAVYRDGQIDVDTVVALEAAVGIAKGFLDRGSEVVSAAPRPRLGVVDRALDTAGQRIADASASMARAAAMLGILPGLAGDDGTKRYFLALQSPSEARGGGGLIGVYGIVTGSDGRLSLGHVGPIEELVGQLDDRVAAPGWFEDLYADFLATREFRFVNMSPHFPTTAQVLLRMYERATGDSLDGVVALDPFALGELTRGTGPLSAPGWDRRIHRLNVRRVLLHDVYRHFDFQERIQNQYLRGLVDELWQRLEGRDLDVTPALTGLAEAVSKQRVKIYVRGDHEQRVLSELGAAGDYRASSPDVQMLFHNNFAANKVDYFLHRTVDIRVRLHDDGSARVQVDAGFDNDAPEEPGSVLVRPFRDDLSSGVNVMAVYLLLPEGAQPGAMSIDGVETNVLRGREGRHPVAWQLLEIAPQDDARLRFSYLWPGAFDVSDGTFGLTLWPQATARPDRFTLEVVAPAGYSLTAGRGTPDPRLTRSGRLTIPVTITASLHREEKT